MRQNVPEKIHSPLLENLALLCVYVSECSFSNFHWTTLSCLGCWKGKRWQYWHIYERQQFIEQTWILGFFFTFHFYSFFFCAFFPHFQYILSKKNPKKPQKLTNPNVTNQNHPNTLLTTPLEKFSPLTPVKTREIYREDNLEYFLLYWNKG